jgi:hypothetical protein
MIARVRRPAKSSAYLLHKTGSSKSGRDGCHEGDPLRVRALARELNEAMLVEERMRVVQRLRALTNFSEVPAHIAA